MKKCPNCDNYNDNDANYCTACGHEFVEHAKRPPKDSMGGGYCSCCGNYYIKNQLLYCPRCGRL